MTYPWNHDRRFNSYTEYFKKIFGQRVQKVTLDAGFSCPNRDGTISSGGCTYCNNDAFNPSYCVPEKTITQQIEEGIEFHHNRYRRAEKYLAYFQAYSNTYAPLEKLKLLYDEALDYPGVIGLVIGTRPDCIDDEKLRYLQQLSVHYYIIIEYGVESCNNNTLKRINRGHTMEQSVLSIGKTVRYGIHAGAHFIIGLPGEQPEDFMKQIPEISNLQLTTIKFHQLQIIKNTVLEKDYLNHPEQFHLIDLESYLNLMVSIAELLNPEIVIERIAAEVPPRYLVSPGWGHIRYDEILRKFEALMEKRNTWQGKFYKKEG